MKGWLFLRWYTQTSPWCLNFQKVEYDDYDLMCKRQYIICMYGIVLYSTTKCILYIYIVYIQKYIYIYFNLWLVDWSDGLMIAICAMVKCQNMVYFPLKGDGHLPLICSHCKGSQYVMDDHTTYTMFGSSPHLGLNMLDIYWAPQIVNHGTMYLSSWFLSTMFFFIEKTLGKNIVLRNHRW